MLLYNKMSFILLWASIWGEKLNYSLTVEELQPVLNPHISEDDV